MKVEFRLTVKNAHFREIREGLGMTQKEMAEYLGVAQGAVSAIECFRWYPRGPESIEKYTLGLGMMFEEIFPEEFCRAVDDRVPTRTSVTREVSYIPLAGPETLILPDPEEEYMRARKVERLDRALMILTDRQRLAIVHRYGLHGEDEKTLSGVGKILGVTATRADQIIKKGLRKLGRERAGKFLKGETSRIF